MVHGKSELSINQLQDFCNRYGLKLSELSTRIMQVDTNNCSLLEFITINYFAVGSKNLEDFYGLLAIDKYMALGVGEVYYDFHGCDVKRIS